jgi:hypothetical protein
MMASQIRTSEAAPIYAPGGPLDVAPLFDVYQRHATAWDELFQASGPPHTHCAALVARLGERTSRMVCHTHMRTARQKKHQHSVHPSPY